MAQKKKEPAKKAPAKNAPAKKAPAKKTPAKKAPAKKAAKKTPAVASATETTTIALPGGVELTMVRIPGRDYWKDKSPAWSPDDIPEKDYWMGKFPVTQAQWEAVTGENPSRFKGAENPVECVSCDDCQKFLKNLNAQPAVRASGLTFRLPEEGEWVFSSLADAEGDYCKLEDGTEITEKTLGEVAWFDKNSNGTTHPVGQKKPNAFGLYDVLGNVWEWTAPADDARSALHGGCWHHWAFFVMSYRRLWRSSTERDHGYGFRLCADRRAD